MLLDPMASKGRASTSGAATAEQRTHVGAEDPVEVLRNSEEKLARLLALQLGLRTSARQSALVARESLLKVLDPVLEVVGLLFGGTMSLKQ